MADATQENGWSPSVKYLLVLLVVEIFVFGLFRNLLGGE